jgi:UDP-4-amino-4,6-dideoxy-N-acetyl-beta-L-altrosamine transaminase
MLPYGRQSISEEDIAAMCAALRSDFLTQGPLAAEFERRFAERVGAKHAVAVNSATAALHLAMRVAGIGRGDRVVTSPNTFLASANCAAYVGAIPDFADINAVDYTLDPAALAAAWRDDTRAVVAVDFAGQTADLPAIAAMARDHGAVVIEDACHAVGGRFQVGDRSWDVGGNPWADMAVFSFHPVKTMTTGEGGMLVTDCADYAERARKLRSHGIERDAGNFSEFVDESGSWLYEMQELGYNYRLSDFQCALGLSQLTRLDSFIARRREIVASYNAAFRELEWLETPRLRESADAAHTSWHLYAVQIDFAGLGKSRAQAMAELRAAGVATQVHYIPVYRQPWYRRTYGYGLGKCPVAERYYERALSLPLFPTMTEEDVAHVIDRVLSLAPQTSNCSLS